MSLIMFIIGLKVFQIVHKNSKRIGKLKQIDKTLIAVIILLILSFLSDVLFYSYNALTKKMGK